MLKESISISSADSLLLINSGWKPIASAGKVITGVFWDDGGFLLIVYCEKGKTITCWYYGHLLVQLEEKVRQTRGELEK